MTLYRDERPWGSYVVLDEGPDYEVGLVLPDGDAHEVQSGSAVDVPVGLAHRIANTDTAEPLTFIEVQ